MAEALPNNNFGHICCHLFTSTAPSSGEIGTIAACTRGLTIGLMNNEKEVRLSGAENVLKVLRIVGGGNSLL